MDIAPIYELRERLKAGAVAGAGLAAGDFRLKRAVEAVAPLEKASPVFAKIGQLSRLAVDEACTDRAGALLDALSLVDAVLCTQGAVGVNGEPEPLSVKTGMEEPEFFCVTNVPYSVLSVLLDALRVSGGGRYSYVVELHEKQPELFEDYRVKTALVDALGASYAELAETVAGWLIQDGRKGNGRWMLPLLQKNFDPRGKKEMVRRVQVMDAVAGGEANDFYLAQLPESEKEVRGALIYALRHSSRNEELLIRLASAERGNNKKMACFALACMDGKKGWEYLETLAKKKPAEFVSCLERSGQEAAAKFTAQAFAGAIAEGQKASGQMKEETAGVLAACLRALPGKTGEAVCGSYRAAAGAGKALDIPAGGGKDPLLFLVPGVLNFMGLPFSKAVPVVLQYGILCGADEGLMDLAKELYETFGEEYFPAAAAAYLLSGDGEGCLVKTRGFVEKRVLMGKKIQKDRISYVHQAFTPLRAARQADGESRYVMSVYVMNPADQRSEKVVHPITFLPEGLIDLLMELRSGVTDRLLFNWIRPEDASLCQKLGSYFYERALAEADNRGYLGALKECGVTFCRNLAVNYFMGRKKCSSWEFTNYFEQLPGDPAALAGEAEQILSLLKSGEIKMIGSCIPAVEDYIRRMKG